MQRKEPVALATEFSALHGAHAKDRRSLALPQKPFDTSGKSPAHIYHSPILQNAFGL
jgi:hypothetical protein